MSQKVRFILLVVLVMLSAVTIVNAQDKPFKVAAVAPSAKNDLAFSQSMFDALTAIQNEMGADKFEFDFQEGTFIVDDAAVALRDWASSGEYDLVIAHGSQYGAIIEELAPEFPEVSFAWGTDVNTYGLPNVFAYTAAANEGGFVNGALAALMTKTGVIGVVGPIEVGDAKMYVDGFVAGAKAAKPDVTVNVTYIQSFSDVPLATEASLYDKWCKWRVEARIEIRKGHDHERRKQDPRIGTAAHAGCRNDTAGTGKSQAHQ